ncbi:MULTISPECIES: isoprenoid biosynthesis glyoxalase ElbB [unclassified Salinivibrio]|uniref:isoprenoid biosynthesis glyoxalase ElbB n=1 Tax=unclassified Salinivibrio TaxID=2636825 RepID=UPI00128E4BE7|nr:MULTISPECIES: isoprenoid biosynthesis glyoxalase ElbB [unclassified Salinivibrio]MPS33278.1 isoprenoid biosynthesis protein ElbB [Salinivibrio sp. VYel7]MPX91781.1 isoprenoid biosynthesis protein ElbB [Salinivibrio sp. VYel1]MPX94662.1 isoprenoid biosynthesis protein ElbB [Salinivibrio sp. VYel9]MPY00942.1 isoprenoid biosynthesis protein ElbB [Salinivibrio sp. VYel4]MPY03954.1 isoprenoid biosynthesis protein ElbB [Salinivibrio sp. VYel5]
MKKVAVILSGCGVFDGAEIQETVLSLLALEQNDAQWQCFAPDIDQHHVINHRTGEAMSETRNVLTEASRIVRGDILPLTDLNADDFDALLVPGGFGAAKNLSDFAYNGDPVQVHQDMFAVCQAFARSEKPAGYMCIAPIMIPQIYPKGVKGTIGNKPDIAAAFNRMGGEHIECPVSDYVLDQRHHLLSTPAYMLATSVTGAAVGINRMVKKLVELA